MPTSRQDPDGLAAAVLDGRRRALARAITLVESERAADRAAADALLEAVLPRAGQAVRLGVSGVPGVGKSTFIEALGQHVLNEGHRLAVLAVDPSSRVSGGSILGDKTRMETLARDPNAFIRPSPAGETLGGVARRTREAMLLCEAAGHDVIIVETVGVGQSETAVHDMVDMFLLLLLPGGGDELQGIKKGIVELADLIVVNKSDGPMTAAAAAAEGEYRNALGLLRAPRPPWTPEVTRCSSLSGEGVPEIWNTVARYQACLGPRVDQIRAGQARRWLWSEIEASLAASLRAHACAGDLLKDAEAGVAAGRASPGAAARRVVEAFLSGSPGDLPDPS